MALFLLDGMLLGSMMSRRREEVVIVEQPVYVPQPGCVSYGGPQPYPQQQQYQQYQQPQQPPQQPPHPPQQQYQQPQQQALPPPPPPIVAQPPHIDAPRVPGGAMPAFSYAPSYDGQTPECVGPDGRPMFRVLPKYDDVGMAPGSPRHAAPSPAPAAGGKTVEQPVTDPLSFSPAYAGQHPIGR